MDKKKFILTLIVCILLAIIVFISYELWDRNLLKTDFENDILEFANNNEDTIFEINKIVFFSNCDAKNKNISKSNFTIENLYQYTDMAFFITSPLSTKTAKNTFKKVYIDNIEYNTVPTVGEQQLYFKSINSFAESTIVDENLINDGFEFSVTSDDETDLSKPTLYNNLANPITLSYVNSNVKTDYTITDTSTPITYDGSLLKRCNVPLDSLSCNVSFDIYIINNLDQEFKCKMFIDIPLETEEKSIYDGNVVAKEDVNFNFYRYK